MQASVSSIQGQLEKLDPSDGNYRPLLRELLSHQDLKQHVLSLDGFSLEGFVELLDKTLGHIPATDDLFRKTLRRLQSICSNREVLPESCLIQSERLSNRGEAIASGGFAAVYEATLDGERKVCVKVLRLYLQGTGGTTKKMFYKEVVVRKRLQHPNIVPFLGVPPKIPPFEIVHDWMENGRITEYVRKNPEVDRVSLLWDIADGLHYLHSCNVIHGDLKGANVLIDGDGRARLTDFGLQSITQWENFIDSPQDHNATDTTTWAAPEILKGAPASKEGDVFTFAMVTIEAFTGSPPFGNYYQAVLGIISGKRPRRPAKLNHQGLWEIMNGCWSEQPKERPTSSQLFEFFRKSFPGRRDAPGVQPLPSASSTRTLVAAEEHMGGNPEQIHGYLGKAEGSYTDPQSDILTLSEKEARERDEKLEGGKRREGLQHEEKEALKDNAHKPTEGSTPEPTRNDVAHPPATQESSPDDRNGNGKNVHPVAGSSARFNIGELSPPSTLSPAEMRRGPRILGLGGTATGVFPPHFDELLGE